MANKVQKIAVGCNLINKTNDLNLRHIHWHDKVEITWTNFKL